MTPYVTPRYDVIDIRGNVACTVRRDGEHDPKLTVIMDPENTEGVMLDTENIPALIDALRRIYRDSKRDQAQYDRDQAAMDAARRTNA